ncbi:hypothetical protein GCK32_011900, partial [Trichostrongylus colubriformis]
RVTTRPRAASLGVSLGDVQVSADFLHRIADFGYIFSYSLEFLVHHSSFSRVSIVVFYITANGIYYCSSAMGHWD